MAQNITISRTSGTRAILTALFAVTVLLIARMEENTLTGLKTARCRPGAKLIAHPAA